jgi:mannitol/fructose-specific phosphotransferase system IIA component
VTGSGEPPFVHVLVNRSYASKRDVIEAIGDAMLGAAVITPAYVDGMHRKEEQGGTIVTTDVALPHGTNDVRSAVLRNALVIAPIPDGVEWAPGRRVRLAIGLAGTGDQAHLRLAAGIARVLSDEGLVTKLKSATEARDVSELLGRIAG